jgi:hypothetical protein
MSVDLSGLISARGVVPCESGHGGLAGHSGRAGRRRLRAGLATRARGASRGAGARSRWLRSCRAMRAATLDQVGPDGGPPGIGMAGEARHPATRSRLWAMVARVSQAALTAKYPDGRCASGPLASRRAPHGSTRVPSRVIATATWKPPSWSAQDCDGTFPGPAAGLGLPRRFGAAPGVGSNIPVTSASAGWESLSDGGVPG